MIHGLNNRMLYSAKKLSVTLDNSIITRGTGFFVEKGNDLFLITNRHVVDPWRGNEKLKGHKITEFLLESFESFDANGIPCILNWEDFRFHPNEANDVACLKNPEIEQEAIINVAIPFELLATTEWLNEKLVVCDTIAYPGYPEWYDRRNNTPIFRMGTVASDPRFDYSYNPDEPVSALIAYEGFSSGGSSGSPVVATQRGFPTGAGLTAPKDFFREIKVIGINAGHFPVGEESHSGISYLYKSSTILDIINSF